MKAIVWQGEERFVLEDVPRPRARAGQVLVKVEAASICGSDLKLARFAERPPVIPGHEAAGTIEELGPGVVGPAIGTRVALDPVQRCGTCHCCTHGMGHLCTAVRHLGTAAAGGTWAQHVAVDAANAHPIPANLDHATASLAEPTAVSYESFQRAGLKSGETVLIVGDGPFGFLHAQIAGALDAGTTVVAGHHDRRLARIKAATGAVVCNTRSEDLPSLLDRTVGPGGVDVAVEATGATASPNLAIRALRPRGRLVRFSSVWEPEPVDMGRIHMRELHVVGSCRSLDAFPVCLEMMGDGRLAPGELVDVCVPIGEFKEAFETLTKSRGEVFKAILLPDSQTPPRYASEGNNEEGYGRPTSPGRGRSSSGGHRTDLCDWRGP